ncbi:unnamed protein product [Amaranthus hypochondriacus]
MADDSHQQKLDEKPIVGTFIVPFPMQGHLNEVLHLGNLVASYNIPVHFVGSTPHNQQAKQRLHGWEPETTRKIHFHDIELPHHQQPNIPLNPPEPDTDSKFPGHLQPLFDTTDQLRQPVFQLVQNLSTEFKRIVIIHDTMMAFVVQDVKSISNAETYAFHSVSAFTIFLYIWESLRDHKPFELDFDIPNGIPSNQGCFTPQFTAYIAKQYEALNFDSGRLYNTSRVIEGKYIDLIAKLPGYANKTLFAIGPLNPINTKSKTRHRSLDWLDKQETGSVLYVSFGTSVSMTEDQINELAIGLEKSSQKFIWIFRFSDRADLSADDDLGRDPLPHGYEIRVQDKGIVIRDWAPQVEILAHPSVGGFMSHCGWNSCMESISMGVPIAAWPMHSDQPRNAVLVTQVLRIGINVIDWAHRSELVRSTTIESIVRRLMTSKEGEAMRKRAVEIGRSVRESTAEGGVSRLEIDSFIAHIRR